MSGFNGYIDNLETKLGLQNKLDVSCFGTVSNVTRQDKNEVVSLITSITDELTSAIFKYLVNDIISKITGGGNDPGPVKNCKSDYSKEFMNDLSNVKIYMLEKYLKGDLIPLFKELYNKNKRQIDIIYCGDNTKKLFEAAIFNKNKKHCLSEIVLNDIINKFQSMTDKLIDENHTKLIQFVISTYLSHKCENQGVCNIDYICKLILCDDPNTIWQAGKGIEPITQNDVKTYFKNHTKINIEYKIEYKNVLLFLMSLELNKTKLRNGFDTYISKVRSMTNAGNDELNILCFDSIKSTQQERNNVLSLLNSLAKTLSVKIIQELIMYYTHGPLGPGGLPPHTKELQGVPTPQNHKQNQLSGVPTPHNA